MDEEEEKHCDEGRHRSHPMLKHDSRGLPALSMIEGSREIGGGERRGERV